MTVGYRKPGDFSWINILSPAPDEARAFFSNLLGWSYVEMPGIGHRIQVGGLDVGGLYDLHGPSCPPGLSPVVGVMVRVDSADATCAKVRELGGEAQPPFDVFDQGRMATCTDPTGAKFDIWEPIKNQGTQVDTGSHGAPSWSELLTKDTEKAAKFYTALFGWKADVLQMPGMLYTTFGLGEATVAGMMAITDEMGPMPPHWGTYFTVADIDAAAANAEKLGANIFMPLMDVPGVGRMCGVISPQGVMFYLITYQR